MSRSRRRNLPSAGAGNVKKGRFRQPCMIFRHACNVRQFWACTLTNWKSLRQCCGAGAAWSRHFEGGSGAGANFFLVGGGSWSWSRLF